MRTVPLPRELALRIGLAARVLPDDGLNRLMDVLIEALGLPLTEAKLLGLAFGELRSAADGILAGVPRAVLREALGYLRGCTSVSIVEDVPSSPEPYDDGDMPQSIRLAVASDSGETLNGSFSTCAAFLIYQVSAREIRLIDRRPPPPANRKSSRDALRTVLIGDCHLLYAQILGTPATARLMRAGIHPVRIAQGGPAREQLAILQRVLRGHPAPWLVRAMGEDGVLPQRVGRALPLLVPAGALTASSNS